MINIRKWLFGENSAAQGDMVRHPDAPHLEPGFPVALLPHHAAIEATRRPILAATQLEGMPETNTGSQLGGRPWWPIGRPYPKDSAGKPLTLLAQINFEDAPVLEDFPDKGLLQVFIGTDDLYGCNVDNLRAPTGFACVYHDATTEAGRTDFSDLSFTNDIVTPLEDPFHPVELSLTLSTMVMDAGDYRFETSFPQIAGDDNLADRYDDLAQDVPPIRLGGYPTFTQTDPRYYDATLGDVTLLTVDTTNGIMWGDSGVAQFFMTREDLAQRDFSRVIYNWDCC